ncbi:MAG: hypothetical protein BZY87_09445 [SAR202 cluster bacterium Io17-Chloro-G6]|nr:MAG: hypothetical protein BZY87_09445 [SAR202 cluster bacterium Io17-Chloro-G6]
MGRKDRERFLQLQRENPDYAGFRGNNTVITRVAPPTTETVVCSVCQRKRNVAADSLPEDVSTYVCLRCRDDGDNDAV